MVVGFNHNFRYNGEVYHIQTEDSGVKSPNIVTLLYQGGTILASKKTSYADIAKIDNLDKVVEELMKEQHKGMLRSLKSGEFDAVIERFKAGKKVTPLVTEELSVSVPTALARPSSSPPPPPAARPVVTAHFEPKPAVPVTAKPVAPVPPKPAAPPAPKPAPPAAQRTSAPVAEIGLDDVILSYLMGDDK